MRISTKRSMRTRDRLEFLKSLEFALESLRARVAISSDELHGPERPDGGAREPHFAAAARGDGLQQIMIQDAPGSTRQSVARNGLGEF